jgi:hypothetical protein
MPTFSTAQPAPGAARTVADTAGVAHGRPGGGGGGEPEAITLFAKKVVSIWRVIVDRGELNSVGDG